MITLEQLVIHHEQLGSHLDSMLLSINAPINWTFVALVT